MNNKTNCIFCNKIAKNKEINLKFFIEKKTNHDILYKDENFFVIKDINPQENTHFLIISIDHIEKLEKLALDNDILYKKLNNLFNIIFFLANQLDNPSEYRLIINNGSTAGQEIKHFHCHFISKQKINNNNNNLI